MENGKSKLEADIREMEALVKGLELRAQEVQEEAAVRIALIRRVLDELRRRAKKSN